MTKRIELSCEFRESDRSLGLETEKRACYISNCIKRELGRTGLRGWLARRPQRHRP
jgi:hypothetical protein